MSPLYLIVLLLPVIGQAERFECRGRVLGAYYADTASACRAFHTCVRVPGGGVRHFRFACPPGTRFHQPAQLCADWADDDEIACASGDDSQLDSFRIGSGFDTKKSSNPQSDDETEFALQRAETGDRRLASDLRTAHSSDFFSGRRDRGRDEPPPPAPSAVPSSTAATRAPYRRPPPRVTTPTTTFATQSSVQPQQRQPQQQLQQQQRQQQPQQQQQRQLQQQPQQQQPQNQEQNYDFNKRKIIRKRPVLASSPATDFPPSSPKISYQKSTPIPKQLQNSITPNYNSINVNNDPSYIEVNRVLPNNNRYNNIAQPSSNYKDNFLSQNVNDNKNYENYNDEPKNTPQNTNTAAPNNYNNQNTRTTTLSAPVNNDFVKIKAQVRNSFIVAENNNAIDKNDYNNGGQKKRIEVTPNGGNQNTASTAAFNDRNSASYTPSKNTQYNTAFTPTYKTTNNVKKYNTAAQSQSTVNPSSFNTARISPSSFSSGGSPTTPAYSSTAQSLAPVNVNTVAYKTNVGFNAQPSPYPVSEEDDGHYKPPSEDDDGQYRPEIYDREILSAAHSLNIAASGNRLPEDQRPRTQTQSSPAPTPPAPRPFSLASSATSSSSPKSSSHQPQQQFTQSVSLTPRPSTQPPSSTYELPKHNYSKPQGFSSSPLDAEQKPVKADSPKGAHKQPPFSKPVKGNKEDTSYDYAYYDSSDPFSEYENIEEFSKTKTKV